MTFSEAKPGQWFRIAGYRSTASQPASIQYRQKLLSLGLTRGTKLSIEKIAPLGDPIEIMTRGYRLSLRKHEANILELELCPNE